MFYPSSDVQIKPGAAPTRPGACMHTPRLDHHIPVTRLGFPRPNEPDGASSAMRQLNSVGLSPFHFSRVFKQSTGMTPLQFEIRERMLKAQRLIRETSRSLIEIALSRLH